MAILHPTEHQTISDAVRKAEQTTSGEIVTVIAKASDQYHYIPLLWAALAALATPLPLVLWDARTSFEIYLIQLAVFIVFAMVLRMPALRVAVVPGPVRRRRAHRQAMEQFLAQNLHTTKGRTGVLIFASLAEHYVEIIADEGIYSKIEPEYWDRIVADMVASLKAGQITEGFVNAIDACGKTLARHFPPGARNENELPDQLIEI